MELRNAYGMDMGGDASSAYESGLSSLIVGSRLGKGGAAGMTKAPMTAQEPLLRSTPYLPNLAISAAVKTGNHDNDIRKFAVE